MMLAELPISFEQPMWLFLLVLLVPTFWIAHRSIGGLSKRKAYFVFTLRSIGIVILTTVLTNPSWVKKGEGVTVTVLLDRSQSVPLPLKRESEMFLREASESRESKQREDRVAVITVARDAVIGAMPASETVVAVHQDVPDATATNLANAVRTALAIMPEDTANRIVLASDGNENVDSVLEAAELASANNVPIDVLILEYDHRNEVVFESIVAPPRARLGQTANVKLVLRSQSRTSGRVYLEMDGQVMDLDPESSDNGRPTVLDPGTTVIPLSVGLDLAGRTEFKATFKPDDPTADYIDMNNETTAVTFVSGEGRILILDQGELESQYLARALREADIGVDVITPGNMTDLALLSSFDAVVLANVPRYEFDDTQDAMLHSYVHDLGGGLIMLGGPQSYGAGQWNDSDVAKVLPVRLDPPQSRKMPRGALALIMHSCEMPQGNFWGQKVAQAAIEAVSRLDYVGILEYGFGVGGNGTSWVYPLQVVGDKSAAIAATQQMTMGDMPDFGASMTTALEGLKGVRAGQKHVIVISDGDPAPPSKALIAEYVAANVTISTVMVGGHGTGQDRIAMQAVAESTGGQPYVVQNPKRLPQIFIKEAQLVSRSLIQEGDYTPRTTGTIGSPIEGFTQLPPVGGYVLTAPREGLAQTPLVINTEEGADPLFACWNYGLGRSIAFTSDATGRWGTQWAAWSDYRDFWEQSMRWVMRPSSPRNLEISTRRDGNRTVVEVEALDDDASFANFLKMDARTIGPDGRAEIISLQQVGPGRYRTEFETDISGSYIVNVSYSNADGSDPGHLQAAVTVPFSDEYRTTSHNAALLRELAERTGGRELVATDPEVADLFNRETLELPRSPRAIWDLLVIIAASLFLFDVAARRLSFEPGWLAALARRAIGRRADASTDTVAAWKRSRSRVEDSRTGKSRTVMKREDADVAAETRFEASDADAAKAIDVGSESPADLRPDAPPPTKKATETPKDDDDEDFTARLLAAKRRARRDDDNADGGKDGSDA